MTVAGKYIGFSGGGWNTHTANAGFMSSALESARQSRDTSFGWKNILDNYYGAAGNSGGSWFLTMLTYSDKFAESLANGANDWFKATGYMGIQKKLFELSPGSDKEQLQEKLINFIKSEGGISNFGSLGDRIAVKAIVNVLFSEDQISKNAWLRSGLSLAVDDKFNWLTFVKNTAFNSYGMQDFADKKFSADRISGADHLELILPGSIDTGSVYSFYKNSTRFSTSATPRDLNFSDGTPSHFIAPVSLIATPTGTTGSEFKFLGSSYNYSFQSEPQGIKKILSKNESKSEAGAESYDLDLSILESATLSGAFAGDAVSMATLKSSWSENQETINSVIDKNVSKLIRFEARSIAKNLLDGGLLAKFFRNLALPVSLDNGDATYQDPDTLTSLDQLASNKNYRFIDGAYVDNSTVANIISQIQASKSKQQDFDLTFFLNGSSEVEIPKELLKSESTIKINEDFANLFGGTSDEQDPWSDSRIKQSPGGKLLPAKTAKPYVFNREALAGLKPIKQWIIGSKYAKKGDKEYDTIIAYYKLDVTTVSNKYLAIDEGQKGEINVFTTFNAKTQPGPMRTNNIFEIYRDVYEATRTAMLEGTGESYENSAGYTDLLAAMGVEKIDGNTDIDTITFTSEDNVSKQLQVDSIKTNTEKLALLQLYKTDSNGNKKFIDSFGSANRDQKAYNYEASQLILNPGEQLSFDFSIVSEKPEQGRVEIEEYGNDYKIFGYDKSNNLVLTSIINATPISTSESGILDETQRSSFDDTYLKFDALEKLDVTIDARSSLSNTIGLTKIDKDPITGNITHKGHSIDSLEFENSVKTDILSNSYFESIKLDPVSTINFEITIPEEGLYAPVMISEKGRVFTMDHDLNGTDIANTIMLGENTIGFEDLDSNQRSGYDYQKSDYDYNDLIINFRTIA